MQSILITGGAGYLATRLIRFAPADAILHATQRRAPARGCEAHTVELTDAAAVSDLLKRLRPRLVVHTAYTMDAGERDIWQATRSVADACVEHGAELLHLSTDLVFDGEDSPYAEDAAPAPVNEYGRWKAIAEEYVRTRVPGAAVVRTSLITGFDPVDPRTEWVLKGLRGKERVSLFTDEIRCPVAVDDLARQIWEIIALAPDARAGVWHLAGPEALSRYALGLLIASRFGLPADRLVPALSRWAPAPRPRDLRLSTGRADRELRTRARPLSTLAAEPLLARDGERD